MKIDLDEYEVSILLRGISALVSEVYNWPHLKDSLLNDLEILMIKLKETENKFISPKYLNE